MTSAHELMSIFLLPVGLLLGFYLAGKILLAPFSSPILLSDRVTFFNVLCYMMAGAVGVIGMYAIVEARGVSVNLYFLLVFVILLIRRFVIRKAPFSFRIRLYEGEIGLLALTLAAVVLFITTQLIRYDFFNPDLYKAGHSDFFFYVSTAEKMQRYHIEGMNFESVPLFDARHYRLPYHYFDLWLNAFIQGFTDLDNTSIYLYLSTPITATFCFLSMAAVYAVFDGKKTWLNFGVAFLVVFYFSILPDKSGAFFNNAILLPKIFPAVVIAGLAFVLLYKKQTTDAFWVLTVMPVMNVLAAPAMLLTIGLAGVYELMKKRYDRMFGYWGICLLLLVFFVAFYRIGGNMSGTAVAKLPAVGAFIKQAFRIFFRDYLARIWFYLLPLLLFAGVNYRSIVREFRSHKEVYGLYGFLLFIGIFFTSIFSFLVDAWQFDYFPSYAALLVLITVLIALYLRRQEQGVKAGILQQLSFGILLLQILFACYISFSPKYTNPESEVSSSFIKEIRSRLPERSIGGIMYDQAVFRGNEWAYNPFVFQDGNFIGLVPQSKDLVLLSLPDSFRGDSGYKAGARALIRSAEFYCFTRKDSAVVKTSDEYQYDYIQEKNIDYLILEKGVLLGDRVKSMVKDVIQDKISGTRLVLLNHS